MDYPADATYNGTRCCGATSVHFIDCREKLDVNDPRSYQQAPSDELVDDGLLECIVCGREVGRGLDYLLIPEGRDSEGEPICEDDWSKVP